MTSAATRRLRVGWLAGLAVAGLVAINAWAIAVARRGAREEARAAFAAEVAAEGQAIESVLAALRADLAFVAASSPLGRTESAHEEALRRSGAESALLLYLHSHPAAARIVVEDADGQPLLHAGRRGGVPLLWVALSPTGNEGVAISPDRFRLFTRVHWQPDGSPGQMSLEVEVEPSRILGALDLTARRCELQASDGTLLARRDAEAAATEPEVAAVSRLDLEGWSAPSPWWLRCTQPARLAVARVESVAARYRTTLLLNLAATALAALLGVVLFQQARRRERLEEQARQEALERQLFHAERLTTAGRLAAGIAHEINNPLEGMSNWLSLARQALADADADQALAHLSRVGEGLDRAAAIVHRVLKHADPAGVPDVVLDLNEILRDTGRFVEERREFSGVAFSYALSEAPTRVRGSAVMLGQLVLNLLLNACEAQEGHGEMHVSSRWEGDQVVAEFADRGPGVAEEDRERIFEPFFSTKSSTGLGLSVGHAIVRQHGGELSVSAREGRGSVFRLSLPGVTEGRA